MLSASKSTNSGGKDVAARVNRLAHHLLGAHIADLSLKRTALGEGALDGRLGDAEVTDLHVARVAHHNIRRADVAVDNIERFAVWVGRAMREAEPLEHLHGDKKHQIQRDFQVLLGTARQDLQQILAAHILHGDIILALNLAEIEDLHHIGMVQTYRDFGLVDKHLNELIIVDKAGQNKLDREFFLEAGRPESLRAKDLGHTAGADLIKQDISPKFCAFANALNHQWRLF